MNNSAPSPLTRLFKSLSDPTRIRLVNLLVRLELSVGETVQILAMSQPRISRHLKILADVGLLDFRRDGLWVFYRATDQEPGKSLLHCLEPLLAREPELGHDLDRAELLVRERAHATIRFFDDIAPRWRELNREALGEFDLPEAILKRMPNCGVAADLGCGPGDLLSHLAHKADHVIGIDNSPNMLGLARSRLHGEERISLRLGDLTHLPLRDSEVDFAVLSMVLHHLPSPGEGLREAARVLSPGGSLVIVDFARHSMEAMREQFGDRWLGFDRLELAGWLAEAGLKPLEFTDHPLTSGLTLLVSRAINPKEDEHHAYT
jgi:ubiquinone/menaquinone biosynthesis C-methylase UbiE